MRTSARNERWSPVFSQVQSKDALTPAHANDSSLTTEPSWKWLILAEGMQGRKLLKARVGGFFTLLSSNNLHCAIEWDIP